jgi:hypothetical protein
VSKDFQSSETGNSGVLNLHARLEVALSKGDFAARAFARPIRGISFEGWWSLEFRITRRQPEKELFTFVVLFAPGRFECWVAWRGGGFLIRQSFSNSAHWF